MSGKTSPLKHTLSWFKHGCCVPTNTTLWIIVVLFMFTVFLFLSCCLTITLSRWMYVRTIRNKTDLLKKRYEEEGKARKETEYKLKEIAMRPINAHHYHQNERGSIGDRKRFPSYSPTDGDVASATALHQNYPGATPKAEENRTTFLPTGNQICPAQAQEEGQGSPFIGGAPYAAKGAPSDTEKEPSTGGSRSTSQAPVAYSTSPSSGDLPVLTVVMEPRDIAATAHFIASSGQVPAEGASVFPGVLLLNKDNTAHGQCPSDKVSLIPSNEKTTPVGVSSAPPVTAQIVAPSAVMKNFIADVMNSDKSASQSENNGTTEKQSMPQLASAPKKRASESISGAPRGHNMTSKKKRTSAQDSPRLSAQSSRSMFPYWTDERRVFSKNEPSASSSGRSCPVKVLSSETNIWAPVMPEKSGAKRSLGLGSGSRKQSGVGSTPPMKEPPLDVYALRRRKERAKQNEAARTATMKDSAATGEEERIPYSPTRRFKAADQRLNQAIVSQQEHAHFSPLTICKNVNTEKRQQSSQNPPEGQDYIHYSPIIVSNDGDDVRDKRNPFVREFNCQKLLLPKDIIKRDSTAIMGQVKTERTDMEKRRERREV